MPLTNTGIRNAKPTNKPQKLFYGSGLFLLISPSGGKWWRLKYRYGGKEKLISLGTYPNIGLKDARERRDEARKLLANNEDPSAYRKKEIHKARLDAATTFQSVAIEWLEKQSRKQSEATQRKLKLILNNDLLPWLGKRPLKEIKPLELLTTIQKIERRGANQLAHSALRLSSKVFQYGVITGRAEHNSAADLRGALEPVVVTHHAAITEPKQVGELLRAIEGYTGTFTVKCALQLSPMVFTRPGELRNAEWSEFNLDKAEWNIQAGRMKMGTSHLVPLSKQALEILLELHLLTGYGSYVFPSIRTDKRPMSDNTVNAALRRLGFAKDEMSGHGFRVMARTILDEVLGFRPDYIEHQLAHAVRDPNGRAYNRTTHLSERCKMMQAWSDYLDILRTGAEVIPLHVGANTKILP